MPDPTVSWTQRLAKKWFPTREARRKRTVQMAVFLAGLICILLSFELLRISVAATEGTFQQTWLSGTAPFGYLLLFVGVGLSLVAFGYLATPLHPWQTATDEYGDLRTLPAGGTVDRRNVAQSARLLFILILVVGLLLLEGIVMYNMATTTHLFDRTGCLSNCDALTRPEIAFLIDLIPLAIADLFVVIMLFVFIQP